VVLPDAQEAQHEVAMLLQRTQSGGTTYVWAELGLMSLRLLQQEGAATSVFKIMANVLSVQIDYVLEDVATLLGEKTRVITQDIIFEEQDTVCSTCKHTGFCFLFRRGEMGPKECRLCFRKSGSRAAFMFSMFAWNKLLGTP
jgi:hypothetical protein